MTKSGNYSKIMPWVSHLLALCSWENYSTSLSYSLNLSLRKWKTVGVILSSSGHCEEERYHVHQVNDILSAHINKLQLYLTNLQLNHKCPHQCTSFAVLKIQVTQEVLELQSKGFHVGKLYYMNKIIYEYYYLILSLFMISMKNQDVPLIIASGKPLLKGRKQF